MPQLFTKSLQFQDAATRLFGEQDGDECLQGLKNLTEVNGLAAMDFAFHVEKLEDWSRILSDFTAWDFAMNWNASMTAELILLHKNRSLERS